MVLAAFSALSGHFALAVGSGVSTLVMGAMFIRALVRPDTRTARQMVV
jgi:hypothetical protein